MSTLTTFNKWPIPDETKDPWYTDFVDLMQLIDTGVYALQNTASNVIIPLGDLTWNGSYKQLTWSNDFLVPLISSNTYLRVQHALNTTDNFIQLDEGDRVVIAVPTSSAGEAIGYVQKINSVLNGNQKLLTLGFLYGNKFYANLPTVIVST